MNDSDLIQELPENVAKLHKAHLVNLLEKYHKISVNMKRDLAELNYDVQILAKHNVQLEESLRAANNRVEVVEETIKHKEMKIGILQKKLAAFERHSEHYKKSRNWRHNKTLVQIVGASLITLFIASISAIVTCCLTEVPYKTELIGLSSIVTLSLIAGTLYEK